MWNISSFQTVSRLLTRVSCHCGGWFFAAAVWACCGTWPPSSACAAAASSSPLSSTGRSSFRQDANTTWRLTPTWSDQSEGTASPPLPPPPRDQSGGSTRPLGPKAQTPYYLLLWEENRRSTKTAAALWTIWTNRSEAKITPGNAFLGRGKVGRGGHNPFLKAQKEFWGENFCEMYLWERLCLFFIIICSAYKKKREREKKNCFVCVKQKCVF